MISVLLVDDSSLTRAVLRDIFLATDDIVVAGEAKNGEEAVAMIRMLAPDLVIMDLMMPVMDGLAAIEEIMAHFPTPILVLSATLDDREVNRAFIAIKKGALDVMEKPDGADLKLAESFEVRIIEKVRLLAGIKVIRRPVKRHMAAPKITSPVGGDRNILAIGASTGGPKAVMTIVKRLPAELRATVFIVQHIASGFARGFAKWLDSESRMRVRLAVDGDDFKIGEALVAPNDCHMVSERGKIRLVQDAPVNCCRPSIDVFFNSLAADQGARVVGVLLTGMGKDGALGLRRIKEQGGVTIAQDKESCAVFGMPKAALELNAVDEVLPLSEIPGAVVRIFGK
ncbi:MAG: two-component system chemotaxis family response regulator [Geobacteraceae bacterium]|nr:MAG: two-component system chemotaxis family response regulator [Geobacteraceae bacterium]